MGSLKNHPEIKKKKIIPQANNRWVAIGGQNTANIVNQKHKQKLMKELGGSSSISGKRIKVSRSRNLHQTPGKVRKCVTLQRDGEAEGWRSGEIIVNICDRVQTKNINNYFKNWRMETEQRDKLIKKGTATSAERIKSSSMNWFNVLRRITNLHRASLIGYCRRAKTDVKLVWNWELKWRVTGISGIFLHTE